METTPLSEPTSLKIKIFLEKEPKSATKKAPRPNKKRNYQ